MWHLLWPPVYRLKSLQLLNAYIILSDTKYCGTYLHVLT